MSSSTTADVEFVVDSANQDNDRATIGDKDDVDARFYYGKPHSSVAVAGDESCYRYRMDHKHRGTFIIINNKDFRPETRMSSRPGTDVDAANLTRDFRRLGFTVTQYNNQTTNEMLRLMIRAAAVDHTDSDCFAVAVLSHGDADLLYGVDNIIEVESFVGPIKDCASLAGKPKIFIFQACRGTEFDTGIRVDAEISAARRRMIPLEADFLYAYCTVPGYYAWRNQDNGSWFVQSLHKMLQKYAFSMDFVSLLTRVSHEVAYEFESDTGRPHSTRMKQVPSIVSMLTKDIYFTPDKR